MLKDNWGVILGGLALIIVIPVAVSAINFVALPTLDHYEVCDLSGRAGISDEIADSLLDQCILQEVTAKRELKKDWSELSKADSASQCVKHTSYAKISACLKPHKPEKAAHHVAK